MFHIVDVDNTLVFTDELNTAGYVHALACMALEPHKVVPRITREIVQEWYPQLSEYDLVHMATLKQAYVESHLDMSQLNDSVARVLSTYGNERCALWTAANPERIRMLLRHIWSLIIGRYALAIKQRTIYLMRCRISVCSLTVNQRNYAFTKTILRLLTICES